MLTKVIETNNKINNIRIKQYVDERGINNIKGCASKEVYEDFLNFCNINQYAQIGYITFRKYLMSKYNLKSKQIRTNNRRVYILY